MEWSRAGTVPDKEVDPVPYGDEGRPCSIAAPGIDILTNGTYKNMCNQALEIRDDNQKNRNNNAREIHR